MNNKQTSKQVNKHIYIVRTPNRFGVVEEQQFLQGKFNM